MFSGGEVPASPRAWAGDGNLGEEGAPGRGLRGWLEILAQKRRPSGDLDFPERYQLWVHHRNALGSV